jgi:hypothetical protein
MFRKLLIQFKTRSLYYCDCQSQSQSYITTDSQSASPSWCQAPIWHPWPIFLSVEIFFRQLRVWYFVALSLTRGRVYNLLSLLVLASAVPLGSESRGTQDHISLSQFLRLPQPGGPVPRIYIPQEQGDPDIPPGTGFPFRRLYDSQGYGGGILSHLHTGKCDCRKLERIYTWLLFRKIANTRRDVVLFVERADFTIKMWPL